jgi:hypothetical protein
MNRGIIRVKTAVNIDHGRTWCLVRAIFLFINPVMAPPPNSFVKHIHCCPR